MTETNLVIFEINPETTNIYRVPSYIANAAELAMISGLLFNCQECPDEAWDIYNKISEYIPLIDALECPITPNAGEQIFYVFFAL